MGLLAFLGRAFGLEKQQGVPVGVGNDQFGALSRGLAMGFDVVAREVRGERLDVVDGDSDPQSHAARFGLAAFQTNAKPVRANFARVALGWHLLEAEHLVESERAFDVGDRETKSGNRLDHTYTLEGARGSGPPCGEPPSPGDALLMLASECKRG